MAFAKWNSFWTFRAETKRRPFIRLPESQAFLDGVQETCHSRLTTIPTEKLFWRAQLDHGWRREEEIDDELPFPASKERMVPWIDKAVEGRANSKGVPCLYMATTREAALSEMRPWIGSYISVATFSTTRELKLVDCSTHRSPRYVWPDQAVSDDEVTQVVWSHIDGAFAEPVTRSDNTADYAATQILAELFKSLGYDGVIYRSPFGENGYNLAIFKLDAVRLINCFLYKTASVKYEFKDTGEYY